MHRCVHARWQWGRGGRRRSAASAVATGVARAARDQSAQILAHVARQLNREAGLLAQRLEIGVSLGRSRACAVGHRWAYAGSSFREATGYGHRACVRTEWEWILRFANR